MILLMLIAMSFVVIRSARAARRNWLLWLLLLWICGLVAGFALAITSTAILPTAYAGIHRGAAGVGTLVIGILIVLAAGKPVD